MKRIYLGLIISFLLTSVAFSQILDTSNNPFGLISGDSDEAELARTAQYLTYGTTLLGYTITGGSFAFENLPDPGVNWKDAMLYSGVLINIIGPSTGLFYLNEPKSALTGMLIRTAGMTAFLGGIGILGKPIYQFGEPAPSDEAIFLRYAIGALGLTTVLWSWTTDTNKIRNYPQRKARARRPNPVFFSAGPTFLPKGNNDSTLGMQMRISF